MQRYQHAQISIRHFPIQGILLFVGIEILVLYIQGSLKNIRNTFLKVNDSIGFYFTANVSL